ncbi:FkbM family methyltransferase [Chryseobacterium taihuense]|uniref:Methyltransferase, FkbM family n=1 Tax=Chryseobacterium taihuense TaxID=1141221 RepID=A0ABY0QTK6_9FLAO|nr:FkbM family methyltransferase [Chryseobacterium taihuense]SDL86138.1 methyltransferase, FkbM family [Chryseobacterium taihuense]
MHIVKSLSSIIFEEGIINFINRKTNKTFLDNRTLFKIKYNDRITRIFLNKKFGYVDNYIYKYGIYEKNVIDSIFKVINPNTTILDIGSNIGQHSLILAPYCKKIYAFEPIPEIYEEFKNSIKANNYKNIVLQNIAIGGKKETKNFYYSSSNAGSSSFIKNNGSTKLIHVKIDLLKNVLPADQNFEIVKIDVEGYEAVVILDNKEIFLKNRPIFFLEFSPNCINTEGSYSATELVNFFLDNNYEIFVEDSDQALKTDSPELYQTANWIVKPLKI